MVDIFGIKEYSFPEGFLWGSSTAAHQIEGNNIHSSNWFHEQEKLKQYPDRAEVSGMACNSYQMFREDVALLEELGHQAFRLGVEWARIEPEEGRFVQAEVDHYLEVLHLLKEKGIKTFVTLVHFSVPLWFEQKGDFRSLENLKYFERYLDFLLPQIAPYVDFWNVINEFNLGSSQEKIDFKFNSFIFHARGYHLIKKYSSAPVSSAHAFVHYQANRVGDPFDEAIVKYRDVCDHEFFFHAVRTGELVLPGRDAMIDPEFKDTADFWSINLYTRTVYDARRANTRAARYPFTETRMLPMRFYLDEFYPECMVHTLTRLTDKPVYITENGCSCEDDAFRIAYLTEYLCALSYAIKMGVDVRGYLYWSLLDNYEWWTFIPKFGLVEVDREHDFKRTPKPSAWFYKEIIENNGFKPEMLKKYLSEMPRLKDLPVLKG